MKKKEENENKENNTKNLTLQRLRGDSGFFKKNGPKEQNRDSEVLPVRRPKRKLNSASF